MQASPAPPIDALPDHLLVATLSWLVESTGLRAAVLSARLVSHQFRTCTNAALEQSLTTLSLRRLDAASLRGLMRCILYRDSYVSGSPRFVSLTKVVLTGCAGVDAQAVELLLTHAPEVSTIELEGTAVRPEETWALAHTTRAPIGSFRIGTWTALHEAVSSSRRFAEAVESGALGHGGALGGVFVDVCNDRGLTPLLVAAYNGVTEAAEWLLTNGASPNACDCYKVSALHKAAYFGHASTVRVLLAYGANSSKVDMYGAGALAKAAYRGHTAVVQMLLAAGARTDGEDLYGNRPLHSAVASGNRQIALMILRCGACRQRTAAPGARANGRSIDLDSGLAAGGVFRSSRTAGQQAAPAAGSAQGMHASASVAVNLGSFAHLTALRTEVSFGP
jgi:hypothetical protein